MIFNTVQPSLRRHFLTILWNQTDIGRKNLQSNRHDLGGVPHLEIELGIDGFFQAVDVVIHNMATVLTEMCGDSYSPSPLGGQRRLDWVRFDVDRASVFRIAGLSYGGDMVDINAE